MYVSGWKHRKGLLVEMHVCTLKFPGYLWKEFNNVIFSNKSIYSKFISMPFESLGIS